LYGKISVASLLKPHEDTESFKEAKRVGTIDEGSGIAARHAAWRVLRAEAGLR